MIVDKIDDNELKEAIEIVGDKLNALVRKPYKERAINIMNDYNEHMYN